MTEQEKNHLSAEYRKTAHDGEFEFTNTGGNAHSLSHQEVIERLKKQKEELIKELEESQFADDFYGKKKR
ncbi:MAG: hypothetical protein E7170_03370 [Firmicutes bacterium]|nr:hypothetical protein [Bacillota bacterium]